MSWISRLANALRPERAAGDLAEELQFHLEQRAADLVRDGLPPAEAERQARRQLGSPLQLREASRDVKSAVWLESLLLDFRFGLRMITKYWQASLAAIASLALAVGACTAAFTLVDALILRPLPIPEPHQLVDLARLLPSFFSADGQPHESNSFSYAQYQLLRNAATGQADLFAINPGLRLSLSDDSGALSENLQAEAISGEGLQILGIRPALGRLIQSDDDSQGNPNPVAVISYGYWKRHYGASPAAIGERFRMGTQSFQIVGVAARSFTGVQPGYFVDVWLPLSVVADPRSLADPDGGGMRVWGRVHPETNVPQLREHLQAVVTNFLRERARVNLPRNLRGPQIEQFTNAPLHIRDASSGADSLFRLQFRRPLWILSLICVLLLLLACSNVASLMLARASARDAEVGLRVSLGAGRSRLIRQMLIETSQIAMAACLLAVGFAALTAPVLVARLGSSDFPAGLDVAPGAATVAFAIGLSFVTALLFGVVPALRASASSPDVALKWGGTARSGGVGALRWMIAAEIGFSVAVLFLSGLLLLSFRRLISVDLGFAGDNVVLFYLVPRQMENPPAGSGSRLLELVRDLPGVEAAAISRQRPMGGDIEWIQTPFIRLPGGPRESVRAREIPVSAGFFETMQIRWISGRDFLPEEVAGNSPSVIVNQAFVDTFLRGRNPIGQRFEKLGDDPDPVPQQIAGVVGNARWNNLREPEEPTIYSPLRDVGIVTLSVRTNSPPASLIPSLRKEIAAASPAFSLRGTILLRDQIENTLTREHLLAILAGFFSVVASLLAAVGLYGVINYSAVRRTREIGIRVALGARRGSIVGLVLSDTAVFVLAGIGLGIGTGLAMGRYLASQLFAVKPTDFWSLTAPVACIVLVALAAVLPPAFRAASEDPLIALKYE
jgi:predicted permease